MFISSLQESVHRQQDVPQLVRLFQFVPDDLQVWFREFKCDVASCELLVDGGECVHLQLSEREKFVSELVGVLLLICLS